jgi:glucan biosynthesis protein C
VQNIERRYDIDWLRVIAIGLLLIYHVAIGFQPWGVMIGFITNDKPWTSLWLPMTMLNVWRIPFLFFVSGVGVYFSMQRRSWMQLLKERAIRIGLPYVFGMFCIFPISSLILRYYFGWPLIWDYNPGHLWFLGNILVYVVFLSPVFYLLKNSPDGRFVRGLKQLFKTPLGLVPVIALFILEERLVQPNPYELYAMTWHGFFLGLLAFFCGFCFVIGGDDFWKMLLKWRWLFLVTAVILFIVRLVIFETRAPGYMIVVESDLWIFSVFAFGHRYFTRDSKALRYLSEAAYPVYILHMIFLFLGSMLIFPLEIYPQVKFVLVLLFTFLGCFAFYEFVIRKINVLRLLFGVKMKTSNATKVATDVSAQY